MPWPGALRHISPWMSAGELLVGGALAQRPEQVGLLLREQAVADLAVGGQPGAVARGAERRA